MPHYEFFDGRVEHGLSYLVYLKLNYFCCIIIFIHSSHSFTVLKLTYMDSESAHPFNVFLDFLGIIESLLLYWLLFDLFKYAQFRHYFRIHSFKVCRRTHYTLTGSFARSRTLRKSSVCLGLHLIYGRTRWLLKIIRTDTVQGNQTYLVKDVEIV